MGMGAKMLTISLGYGTWLAKNEENQRSLEEWTFSSRKNFGLIKSEEWRPYSIYRAKVWSYMLSSEKGYHRGNSWQSTLCLAEKVQSHLLLPLLYFSKVISYWFSTPGNHGRVRLAKYEFYSADWTASKSHIMLETISTLPLKGNICVGK